MFCVALFISAAKRWRLDPVMSLVALETLSSIIQENVSLDVMPKAVPYRCCPVLYAPQSGGSREEVVYLRSRGRSTPPLPPEPLLGFSRGENASRMRENMPPLRSARGLALRRSSPFSAEPLPAPEEL